MFVSYTNDQEIPFFSMDSPGDEIDLATVIYLTDIVYAGIWTGTAEAVIAINELHEIGEQLYKELYNL